MTGILCALFLLSGAAALIFETLWFRQAGIAFGNSVWASSLVLASFMAGLALGNGLMARFGSRVTRPIRFYALLEAILAVTGVSLVWLLPVLGEGLAPLFRSFLDIPWLLNPLRLGIGFSLLLIPATAMGATLPVLVHALSLRDPNFGSVLGRLYGFNTLGAVAGAVAGEAALLDWFGVRGTALVAGGCNALASIVALLVARRLTPATESGFSETAPLRRAFGGRARRTLAAAFCAGGILLAFEVVWFRFLHLFVHSGGLVFSLMLAVVLAGIALGGFAGGLWLRRDRDASRYTAAVALAAGALGVALYAGFSIPLAPHAAVLQAQPSTVLGLSAALMFPVSLLSGILFTLMGATLHAEIESDTRAAGWLTLANTLGGALGSGLGGFVLLPLVGMEGSFCLLSAGYAAVAWLARFPPSEAARLRRPETWAAVAFVAAFALFPFGKLRSVYLHLAIDRWNRDGSSEIVAVSEGRTETSVLLQDEIGGNAVAHRLFTDGFAMSSTTSMARRYQKLYVYWPVALHAGPSDALVISYGVGNTAKALVDTRSLEHIDVVDISREILALSDIVYPDPAERPLLDPRVHVHIEDGRFFLQSTDRRYDLITGEPPPPKNAGVVNLYTREYFQLIFDRLAEGGIATYWLPVHNTLLSDTKAIIRAFCDVFAECSLWSGRDLDWMLVGHRGDLRAPSEEALSRQWRDPSLRAELAAVGVELPEQLGALFMADAEQLRELVGETPPLTDDRPKRLSNRRHSPLRARQTYRDWMDFRRNRERFRASAFVAKIWPASLRERSVPYFDVQRVIQSVSSPEPVAFGERLRDVHRLLTETPVVTAAMWRLGASTDSLRVIDGLIAAGASVDPYRDVLARRALARREFDAAAAFLDHAAAPTDWRSLYFRWFVLEMAGRRDEARVLALAHRAQLQAEVEARDVWVFMERTFGPLD